MSTPSLTDEQFKKHASLGRLESQAYFLCQQLSSIYYSVDSDDRDQYDDARLIAIMDKAHDRRQRRYSAFQSYSKSIGL
jgi:hypothetical protein